MGVEHVIRDGGRDAQHDVVESRRMETACRATAAATAMLPAVRRACAATRNSHGRPMANAAMVSERAAATGQSKARIAVPIICSGVPG